MLSIWVLPSFTLSALLKPDYLIKVSSFLRELPLPSGFKPLVRSKINLGICKRLQFPNKDYRVLDKICFDRIFKNNNLGKIQNALNFNILTPKLYLQNGFWPLEEFTSVISHQQWCMKNRGKKQNKKDKTFYTLE